MLDTTKMRIQGHVLTALGSRSAVLQYAVDKEWDQFSVFFTGAEWSISHALEHDERAEFKWLYHRMEAMKPKDKPPTGPRGGGPGGRPTPPNSGGGSVFTPEFVEVIAA